MRQAALLGAFVLIGSGGGGLQPAPSPEPAADRGEVVVELVVEDELGRPIRNLEQREVVVDQDGVHQKITSFKYWPERGWYEVRYVPASGRAGAVAVGVNRRGSRLRGPDGPQVKPRWIPPVPAFEAPLRAALDAPEAPGALAYQMAVLRFETREDTLHHSFLAEIPLREVSSTRAGSHAAVRLAFLLRVKREDGSVVHEGSLDQPLDVQVPSEAALDVQRFIWSSHVHLRAGRYVAELAVRDAGSGALGVRRMPLVVEAWPATGLRMSSLSFLLGLGGLMQGEAEDNPFRLEDEALVPMLKPTWVMGSGGALSLLAEVYPDRTAKEPVTAAIELYRGTELRAKAAVPLPALSADGVIRYVGGLKFTSLVPGLYTVKLVAQQGGARVEEAAVLEVIPTLPRRGPS